MHDLEAVDRQAAPVRVVAPLQHRLLVVLLGLDRLGDARVAAVGADHDAGAFDDRCAVLAVAADADDCAVLDDDLLDGEALAHLGAGVGRRRRRGSCRARCAAGA